MPACHAGGRGFESRPVRQISMIMDILYFIAAIQIGVIVTHLFLTTPIIFKVLKEEEASSFLRTIFPRYYLALFLLSIPILINELFNMTNSTNYYLYLVNSSHAFVGLVLIPLTNTARDRNWQKVFSFLHGFSVYCTLAIAITAIVYFFNS